MAEGEGYGRDGKLVSASWTTPCPAGGCGRTPREAVKLGDAERPRCYLGSPLRFRAPSEMPLPRHAGAHTEPEHGC